MSKTKGAVETFVDMLARVVTRQGGSEILVDLDEAVERLYDGKMPERHYSQKHEVGCGCEFYTKTFLKKARREILEHTKGQPFRLDTPNGPFFLERALWYFAGCSGPYESPESKDRPTWDGDAMLAAGTAARAKASRGQVVHMAAAR